MYKFQPSKRNNFKKGFSLIEILVAISLSLIILGALYSIYYISQKIYVKSSNKAELNQNGRISLERIARDLRQTSQITTDLLTINDPPSPLIMFQDGNDTSRIQYIEYSLVSNELHRKLIHYCPASPSPCDSPDDWVVYNTPNSSSAIDENTIKANKITSLVFYGGQVITVGITTSDNQDNSAHFQTEVYCRNI